MAHQVIFSRITSVCRNIMHSHTKWFYLLFGIVLAILTQFSLSTRALASRSGDSIMLANNYEQKTPEQLAENNISTITTPRPTNYISIDNKTIPIFYSDNTQIDAGSQVGKYGHLLYGHNSYNVFGGLSSHNNLSFSVTLDGATTNYHVINSITLTRETAQNLMLGIRDGKIFSGGQYNHYPYILMTCAGTPLGNGDATHRTLFFAVQD